MSRIELDPELADDFERILAHLAEHDAANARARVASIFAALDILGQSPLIGRRTKGSTRELIIGPRAQGFVALYRYAAEIDTVFVLAIRSQRESGYHRA